MDATVSIALEEICSRGGSGITLSGLWSALEPSLAGDNLNLSPGLKQALWTSILAVPALHFEPRAAASSDAAAAEELGTTIVADERLRNSFLGLYNPHSANSSIPPQQRRALERLAVARKDGIIQSQLAKEFGIEGKNLFYVLKSLECQGLIVKQSAVVKTKEASEEGESRYIPSVTTNLVYLSRYAKYLGFQQKFQITKEEQQLESTSNANGKVKEDVLVKDYLPLMKAVCDLLENANGKVLVVSDIKRELGYGGSSSSHREWRQVSSRLRDAEIVMEFDAKVNDKVERCMRLLKTFSTQSSETKHLDCPDYGFGDGQVKFGKRRQPTNQLVELPIEQQIFSIIDAAGSEGLTMPEIYKSLGIDNKKNHNRIVSMFSRLGMDVQAENQKKCVVYRVWAPGKHNPETAQEFLNEPNVYSDDRNPRQDSGNINTCDWPVNLSVSTDDTISQENTKNKKMNPDLPTETGSEKDTECGLLTNNSLEMICGTRDASSEPQPDVVIVELGKDNALSKAPSSTLKLATSGSKKRQLTLPLTVGTIRRKKRILERLQNEKFLIRVVLQKWLESVEKDKGTTTDKKTIIRLLIELQEQGHCKCIDINVPFVTNFGSSRTVQVILHPSVSLTPELVTEIHDQLRSFEIQSRGQCSSRARNSYSVPVLKDVERTKIHTRSDDQALKYETRRANGFILAKMIRAKLLHGFLWEHVYGSGGSDNALSSEKSIVEIVSDNTVFSLEAAIKAIPIELFLQVVGSTQKFDDMVEKCRRKLRLSDLPIQEQKALMDTLATGRLSLVVEILRRLKLIRMASGRRSKDGSELLQESFQHALEFRPYIEEPVSKDAISLTFRPLDYRPRIRHDFVLSNRKAVDEYWETLEYCYAVADPRAALHAFPGSAVHELFIYRSWASVRVMTADQRAQLLKHVMKDGQSGKLSFKDCGKIAKDLNLSLEQVLRVYYDKRQSRLNKVRREVDEFQTLRSNRRSSLRKRERSPELRPSKFRKIDEATGELDEHTVDTFMDGEPSVIPSGKRETDLQELQEADQVENEGDLEPNEEEKDDDDDEAFHSGTSRSAISKMKPARQRRFTWTEEADRQLVIQYARQRVVLGAKYHRTDWSSISNLPAPPSTCRKRMALLNKNANFRKAVMKLCNELSERYVKFLAKTKNCSVEKSDCKSQDSCDEAISSGSYDGSECTIRTGNKHSWDDFDNRKIKVALDEALRWKRMAKLEASKRVESVYEGWPDLNINADKDDILESDAIASTSTSAAQNHEGGQKQNGSRRSRAQRLHRRFIKILNEEVKVSREVQNSLAISNAVELFKLIFLSNSNASAVPNMLAEILRCYSEHDLYAAFNYLRDKKFMVGGIASQPYSLSQQFVHNISKSPFPANSGTRAAKFANWLHERERDLGGGFDLSTDLQCGDIFHLFALVSLDQLSLSTHLPDEGVGEAVDTRSTKRKIDSYESPDSDKAKKLKSLIFSEGELISRREKGFPGIMVSIHRKGVSTADLLNLFTTKKTCNGESLVTANDLFETTSDSITFSDSVASREILNSDSNFSSVGTVCQSPWTAMASYAMCLLPPVSDKEKSSPFDPEVFSSVYNAIRKAGDQGLSVQEVYLLISIPDQNMCELVISVLQTFGRALKVNAFDSVHIVDASYRSKYCLTLDFDACQNLKASSWEKTIKGDNRHLFTDEENHNSGGACTHESDANTNAVHKVSILNFPEEVTESLSENQTSNVQEGCFQVKCVSVGKEKEDESLFSSEISVPILPWINGDGTMNKVVYKGLRRRILGVVMQNPGILEDDIINHMDVLNPQSCRKLLELMVLDDHIRVKKMHQTSSKMPPSILGSLLSSNLSKLKSKVVCRDHFFANPLSSSLL